MPIAEQVMKIAFITLAIFIYNLALIQPSHLAYAFMSR